MYNLKTIFRQIFDEECAVSFLQDHEIIPKVKMCDNNHEMKLSFSDSVRWRCHHRACRKKKAIRCGTWLENSKLPLETVVHFIYAWSEELTSVKFCAKHLNMCQGSTVDWNNYLREVCVWKMTKASRVIGGEGKIVEIDESLFVKRKYNVGRILPQQWVFGGLCRETNECFLELVPDRSEAALLAVIDEKILPGTTIISDCWKGYLHLNQKGYNHQTINHRYNFVDPETLANTQRIERLWGSAKWGNKKRRGTNRDFLACYLAEFMWRTQLKGEDYFIEILKGIVDFWIDINK